MRNPVVRLIARLKFSSRFWPFPIFLAAFALRLYRLGVKSLWYDETVSMFIARQDLDALTRHTAGDIHPPLYYYLLHFWGRFAGWSEFSGAFLSLFFGILLIALVYRVAKEWFGHSDPGLETGEGVGLIAALLVAASPYNLWYSQEVRMYTLGAVLGLASVYFFVRLLAITDNSSPARRGYGGDGDFGGHGPTPPVRGPVPEPPPGHSLGSVSGLSALAKALAGSGSRKFDFAAYALVSALGMYTLYYFAFLLVFENLVALVWVVRERSSAVGLGSRISFWLASQFAIIVLYLPWLTIALHQATDPPVPPWRSFIPLPNVLSESFSALTLGQSLGLDMSWAIVFFVFVLFIFTFVREYRPSKTESRPLTGGLFLLGYTFVPVLALFALSYWKPLYHVRYVFLYSPGFYLLWALGLERIRTLRVDFHKYATSIAAGSLLLIAAIGLSDYNFWFNPHYADDDLRGAVQYIAARWRPGDAILINAGYAYTALVYYYDQPIEWRGRLTNYPPAGVSLGTFQRLVDLRAGAIVLQTGSIGGSASLGWGSPESDFYATTADETRAALDAVFALHPRIWMLRLYDTVVDPDGIIREDLAQKGRLIDGQGFAGESFVRVEGYLTSRAPLTALSDDATPRQVLLGQRIALLGFSPATTRVQAGNPLDVDLYWQAHEPTNVDDHVYIGMYGADGRAVASTDDVPLGNALGTSRWTPDQVMHEPVRLMVPVSVPPGNYVLRVAMYNPLTDEPLDAGTSPWAAGNGQINLTQVEVVGP
jgi:uncharacterized membrane protein